MRASKDALAIFAKGHAQDCESPWRLDHRRVPGSAATDHAERHAPKGANASKRMDPDKAARRF
jgi:hypothetical protein